MKLSAYFWPLNFGKNVFFTVSPLMFRLEQRRLSIIYKFFVTSMSKLQGPTGIAVVKLCVDFLASKSVIQ